MGLDAVGVDDGGDREDDQRGDQSLRCTGQHLGHSDQPDRAGRLHTVLDLLVKPNSCARTIARPGSPGT